MFSSEVGYSLSTRGLSNITNQYSVRGSPNLAMVLIAQPGELFNAFPSCLPETLGWKVGQQLPPSTCELSLCKREVLASKSPKERSNDALKALCRKHGHRPHHMAQFLHSTPAVLLPEPLDLGPDLPVGTCLGHLATAGLDSLLLQRFV